MHEDPEAASRPEGIEMPRPTAAPMILAVGMILLAAGAVLGVALSVVGAMIFIVGLGTWIGQLLPGRGHFHEKRVEPAQRAQVIAGAPGTVEQLLAGMPGYRMRLPLHVHPISAGIRGGLLGGLLMPVPALLWGVLKGHGIWYPVNLLAGMVMVGVNVAELEEFRLSHLLVGIVIHAVTSVVAGLMYGVLLPMLPAIPNPMAWAGLLMPLLWTALSFGLMAIVNPVMNRDVSWPWFIASQFVFGVVMAAVVQGSNKLRPIQAGILGGIVGGSLMAVPAMLWGLATGQGIWYPVNLLAGMVQPGMYNLPASDLRAFNATWLA